MTVYPRHRGRLLNRLRRWLNRPQPAGQHHEARAVADNWNPLSDAVRADITRRTRNEDTR